MTLLIQDVLLKYMLLQKALPAFSSISHASNAHLVLSGYTCILQTSTRMLPGMLAILSFGAYFSSRSIAKAANSTRTVWPWTPSNSRGLSIFSSTGK